MKKALLLILVSSLLISVQVFSEPNRPKNLTKDTIRDENILLPEALKTNMDALLSNWLISNYMTIDKNCVSNSVNPNFSDSVYIQRLAKLPKVIEMPYNQIVRSYINMYAQRLRDRVSYMKGLSRFYFPLFEQALDAENMPLELKYIPVIESALNPSATSKVGAAGLWQFMVATGKQYGLEVNSLVDERRDPIKSTYKAVKYFKELYRIYGDWGLAIAAYNCGPGNVNKAIRRSGGKKDFWDIYFFLPKETRGYIPAFIAVNYLLHYSSEHNICEAKCNIPLNTDTVVVSQMVHFQQIADVLKIPVEEIRTLNPSFRRDIIPGDIKPYVLRLPMFSAYAFIDNIDSIVRYRSQDFLMNFRKTVEPSVAENLVDYTTFKHKVRKGESIQEIASRYNVSVADLKDWNHLRSSKLSKGHYLAIRKEKPLQHNDKDLLASRQKATPNDSVISNASKLKAQEVKEEKLLVKFVEQVKSHIIRKGETIGLIADNYNVKVSDLKRWNNLKTNKLSVGKKIAIHSVKEVHYASSKTYLSNNQAKQKVDTDSLQNKALASTKKTNAKTQVFAATPTPPNKHLVKKGETIYAISKMYNVTVSDIMEWNNLQSSTLALGAELVVSSEKQQVSGRQNQIAFNVKNQKTDSLKTNNRDSANVVLNVVSSKPEFKNSVVKFQSYSLHTVKTGDTLWAIANQYPGITVKDIMSANKLKRQDAIQVGMKIIIPKT